MQRIILFPILLLSQFIFSQEQDYDVVFKNVNVVTIASNVVLENQNVAVKDGKIAVMESSKKSKLKGVKTIDLKGRYIMPSLADAHVHFPAAEDEMERMLQLNLVNGVTKLRSMRGDWNHYQWRAKYNAKGSYYPKMYLSAPPVLINMEGTPAQWDEFVKGAKDYSFNFIKVLGIKDQPTFKQLDSICKKYNMPLAGHFPHVSDDVFFNSNYNCIEHLGGLAGEQPATQQSRMKAIKDKNMYLCPTLSWYNMGSCRYTDEEYRNMPGMAFVPKKILDSWAEKTEKYRADSAFKDELAKDLKSLDERYGIIKKLNNLDVPMLLSPDSSGMYMVTGFGMVGEMELLKNAQLENLDILKMATANFGAFFKENYGILSVGKDADFIVTDENPLTNIETLRNVKGLYYNDRYLSSKDLMEIKDRLLTETNK